MVMTVVGERRRILFLARALTVGGAERQLVVLARGLHARGHDVAVCVFYGGGPLQEELERSGVRVLDLGKRGRWDMLSLLTRFASVVRRERPDVIHAYLGVANIVSALVRKLSPRTRVVWGVRSSMMDHTRYDAWEGRIFAVSRLLARSADLIISNSEAGSRDHVAAGYPADRMRVIPNGIDTVRFSPDADGRARLRAEWDIGDAPLVGVVARLDPMKDHPTFLKAVAQVQQRRDVRAVCVGDGPTEYRDRLARMARDVRADVRWEPARKDLSAVYSALDVSCSSSAFGEGFSNVVAESMACGTPCVATNVGDSAMILDGLGALVPPGDVDGLAVAIETLLDQDRCNVGPRLRGRIEANFGVDRLVLETESALVGLCQ